MATMTCPRCGGTVRIEVQPPTTLVVHADEHRCTVPRAA